MTKDSCPNKKIRDQRGFSLVELSIVLLMAGFFIVIIAQTINMYVQERYKQITKERIELAKAALDEYYGTFGRYPYPAIRGSIFSSKIKTHGVFGVERPPNAACSPAPFNCTNIGTRDTAKDTDTTDDRVVIGFLPYQTLVNAKLQTPFTVKDGFDAWGMNFTYAVTDELADPSHTIEDPANFHFGAIDIIDENGLSVLDPPKSAHYVVVSHGENRSGAFTDYRYNWSIGRPCLTATEAALTTVNGINDPSIPVESENCDNRDGIFVAGIRSVANDAQYFDDYIKYSAIGLRSHWRRALGTAESRIYNTNTNNVGIGDSDPSEGRLSIDSDVSAENSIAADAFCDLGGANCIYPSDIAGIGTACPPGEAATAIREVETPPSSGIFRNSVVCAPAFTAAPTKTCGIDAGTGLQMYLVGFSNLGNIRCCTNTAPQTCTTL